MMRMKCTLCAAAAVTLALCSFGPALAQNVRWHADGMKNLTGEGWSVTSDSSDRSSPYFDGSERVWRIVDDTSGRMEMYKSPGTMSTSQGIIMARIKVNSSSSVPKGTFGYTSADGNHSVLMAVRNGEVNFKTCEDQNTAAPLNGESVTVSGGTTSYRVYAIRYYSNGTFSAWVSNGSDWSNSQSGWTQLANNQTWVAQSALVDGGTARTGLVLGSFGPASETWDGNVSYICWSTLGIELLPWTFDPGSPPPLPANAATQVSDTIPAVMMAGQQYNVSVTVRNVGSSAWTPTADYKLGAVDDNDPFADTRHYLAVGESVAPDAQKTFSFTMTAPSTQGTYTTDWQMVQDGVGWFGETLTKQVVVNSSSNLVLNDPLQGSSSGIVVGGQFVSGGWKTLGNSDSIRWSIDPTVTRGKLEFDVTNLSPQDTNPTDGKGELAHMYDNSNNNADINKMPGYDDNLYGVWIRKLGVAYAEANHDDAVKVLANAGVPGHEDYCAQLSWDPNTVYHFVVEWEPGSQAGTTTFKFWRDSTLLKTLTVDGASYNPPQHRVRIGASPRNNTIPNAIFSNVKLWNYDATTPPVENTFTDITDSAGTAGPGHFGGHGVMWADATGDGRPDAYVTMNYGPTDMGELFYRNTNGSVFVEEAASRGIDDFDAGSHGAVWADLDNDGDYDLVNGGFDRNRVFENNGSGQFTDRTSTSGFLNVNYGTRGVVAFDSNNNGRLDVLCNNASGDSEPNEFYINNGNFSFTSANNGLANIPSFQGVTVGDYDNDGDLDVVICRWDGPLTLMQNNGGQFTQVSRPEFDVTSPRQEAPTFVDVNNDGWLDLHVQTGDGNGYLFINNQNGTFTQKAVPQGPGFMAGFEDLNNDGTWDMVYVGDNKVYYNDGLGNFTASATFNPGTINDPRAIAFADIDGDGDMDFFYAQVRTYNRLIRNDLAAGTKWLKVRLTAPNRQAGAFGAKVKLYEPGQAGNPSALISFKEARSQEGYLAQNEPVLHFGLGARSNVDVQITFLDGTVVTRSYVSSGQTISTGVLQYSPTDFEANNPTYSGNPYDLIASATFVHPASGETRTTGMFYAGGTTWKFRFTGTRPGVWNYTTSSGDPDLNGLSGTVTVEAAPQGSYGFVSNVGNRWVRPKGPEGTLTAFVPQYVMYAPPSSLYNNPSRIDSDVQTFFVQHGFNGFHTGVSCGWFDIDRESYDDIPSMDPNPDSRTFEALEMLINKVHAAGGVVHIWAWGDEDRHMTPIKWGINGTVDKRLQRYIAARLGPLPGWTMGYGFDNWEWVTGSQLTEWRNYMHQYFGWPHMLSARNYRLNEWTQLSEAFDYSSYEQWRPDYNHYVQTIEDRPTKPSFSEDRFRVRDPSPYPEKDYNELDTRRGLWHSTMAGGVANIWGYMINSPADGASAAYPNPHWSRTYKTFFENRFLLEMVRDNTLTNGVCLRTPDSSKFLFYREGTNSISMNLSGMSEAANAVAIDTLQPYQEINIGPLQPGQHTWTAPSTSDWAIAVGTFESTPPPVVPVEWDSLGEIQNIGGGQMPAIATDSAGNLHIIYLSGNGLQYKKYDSSMSLLLTEQIASPTGGAYWPHIVCDSNNAPHIVFTEAVNPELPYATNCYYTNRTGGSWKAPLTAYTPAPGDTLWYTRVAVYGNYAYVGFQCGIDPELVGAIVKISNLSGTPTVDRTVITETRSAIVINSAGQMFAPGRYGAAGTYVQEYDYNLNTVGSLTRLMNGYPGGCQTGWADKNNVLHFVAWGLQAGGDYPCNDRSGMNYNSTARRNPDGSFQDCIQGLLGGAAGTGPDSDDGSGWWNDDVAPVITVDATGTVYVAWRAWTSTGEGRITKVDASGFTQTCVPNPLCSGSNICTGTQFSSTTTRRRWWNCETAPALTSGVYVVWEQAGTCYLRTVGVGSVQQGTPPGPVTGLTGEPSTMRIELSWTNPTDSNFAATKILYKTNGFPSNPYDGTVLYDGADASYVHTGIGGGVTYYYAAFAHNGTSSYATGATCSVESITPYCYADDFTYVNGALSGVNGWSGSGGASIAADNQKVKISGGTTNLQTIRDVSCSGIAGIIWVRAKVQAGYGGTTLWSLRVDDPAGANLARWYGSGTMVRGRIGDSATVTSGYSLSGPGVWDTIAVRINTTSNQSEFFLNETSRGSLDHTATPGNTVGKVWFERVYNSAANEYVYLDDVTIGGPDSTSDTTPPGPVTAFSATGGAGQVSLSWTNPSDSDFAGTMLRYKTNGYPTSSTDGTLVTNESGAPGAGDSYVHTGLGDGITYYYSAFAYDASLNYSAKSDASATTLVGVCFQESFPYPNSNLSGNNNWTGAAGSEIAVTGETVKITGGVGLTTVTKSISCSGTGGMISVKAQVKAGTGGDTLWGFWIDDASGNNLARWYGAGTTARGRIGGESIVTGTQNLTGPTVWDDLEVLINTTADTSQFFFNGVSMGTLSHVSQGAGNSVGRIKFERIDNNQTIGHTVYFDNIMVGSPDTTPPGPVTNFTAIGGNGQVSLTWTNPTDADFAGTMIRFKTGGYPTSQTDGTAIYTGTGTSYTHTGRSNGTRYYYSAFAFDGTPNYSTKTDAAAHAAADVSILEVKGLANSQVRALRGNIVSATGSGYFYLQDPNVLQGIKAVSSVAVTVGQTLDVIGVIGGSSSERQIDISGDTIVVTDPGPIALDAVGMGAASVGGSLLNALAPGVVDGRGPNNIGLLALLWGKVTQRDKNLGFFYIDDGSGLRDGTTTEVSNGVFEESVGVRILANPTSYPEGSYLTVRGVVSSFNDGGLRPQILPNSGGISVVAP